MTNDTYRGPLAGLQVMEFGSSFAAPFAARILADLGARVLKVEHPDGGDPSRGWGDNSMAGQSPAFQTFNHNKRSMTADFKDSNDIAKLQDLMGREADVVLQNLRPGVADRLGLGAEAARERNPRLVYCNIGAFGDYGPYDKLPGYDPLMQAFTGIIEVTGDPEGDPARVGVPIIDLGTGMWAAIGILAALQQRERTGEGCIVDSALMETGFSWQSFNFSLLEATGKAPQRMGLRGPLLVPNAAFKTADGRLIVTVGTDRQFKGFCVALHREDLSADPRYRDNRSRMANEQTLNAEITKTLLTKPWSYWAERLDAANVPNAPVQSLEQAIEHPQTIASGLAQIVPGSDFRQMSLPLRFDGNRPAIRRPAPILGEANRDLFDDSGALMT